MEEVMHNHPKTAMIKRGGKYRRAFFVQPYLAEYEGGPQVTDVYRVAAMEI